MPAIEYQKVMSEIVYINLPGPKEPMPGMSGGELLHGFLAELYYASDPSVKNSLLTFVTDGIFIIASRKVRRHG